jgi:hypothetical protein
MSSSHPNRHLPPGFPFPRPAPPSIPSPPQLRLHIQLQSSIRLYDLSGRHSSAILFGIARAVRQDPFPEETLY